MKARRGISSIVGMVFAIIALTTVISYIGYSMDTIEGLNQVIITKGIENIDKIEEDFDILTVNTTDSGKFNIAVQNTGNIPINFTRLWVQNITHPTDWVSYYTINEGVSKPSTEFGQIAQPLNRLFAAILCAEKSRVVRGGYPFGVSVICVAQKGRQGVPPNTLEGQGSER